MIMFVILVHFILIIKMLGIAILLLKNIFSPLRNIKNYEGKEDDKQTKLVMKLRISFSNYWKLIMNFPKITKSVLLKLHLTTLLNLLMRHIIEDFKRKLYINTKI